MKVKLLIAFSLFTSQFTFSQNEELLQGKVVNQNRPIKDVDIINFNTKAQTITDQFGNFSITAKNDDLLVFISKDYEVKRLVINPNLFDQNSFLVVLNLKPEELKEVVITKMESIKLGNNVVYEKGKRDEIDLKKAYNASNNRTVYDGFMDNAMQIILKEKSKKFTVEIEFAALAKKTCKPTFFTNNLKLKQDEIELFLQFCDADSKSEKLKTHTNILSMMDFLAIKNKEFQKVKGTIK